MAYVIAQPCVGTRDASCVGVCPVDCTHSTPDEEWAAFRERNAAWFAEAR